MIRSRHGFRRIAFGGLLALTFVSISLRAQDGGRLEADAPRPAEETAFSKLRSGDTPVGPAVAAQLEKKAKYLVYRLTWPEVQMKSVEGINNAIPVSTLSQVFAEFERSLPDYRRIQTKEPVRADKQRKFVEEFSKHLVPCIEKVLKQGAPIARINAARMLAKLGEYGHEELADPLAAALEDSAQIDAAKYWAAVGMRDLFANADKIKEEREFRSIQALLACIHRPPNLPQDAGLPELGGFFVVRRAYIAALGANHKPALVQNRKVVAQPALHLVRIVSKDGLPVIPHINERIEAAVGLGQLQQKYYENYQADYAAYHVGHMLMDFFAAYSIERQDPAETKREPWRIHAARLKQAFQNMAADSKNAYVNQLQNRVDGLFDQVITNQAVVVKPFADWLAANPPKSTSLYKDDPKAIVNLPKTENQ